MITGILNTPEGALHYKYYPSEENYTGIYAIILHGWGENSDWYQFAAKQLNTIDIGSLALDFRGHGESFGKKGYVNAWQDYQADLKAGIEKILETDAEIRLKQGNKPASGKKRVKDGSKKTAPVSSKKHRDKPKIFIIAQSMGSLVALRYMQNNKKPGISGAVLASLPLGYTMRINWFNKKLLLLLNGIYPSAGFKWKVPDDLRQISKTAQKLKNKKEEPPYKKNLEKPGIKGHRVLTPRWLIEFQKNVHLASTEGAPKNVPLLLLHGQTDSMINIKNLKNFAGKYKNIIIKSYEGFGHKLINSSKNYERKVVSEEIVRWILQTGLPDKKMKNKRNGK